MPIFTSVRDATVSRKNAFHYWHQKNHSKWVILSQETNLNDARKTTKTFQEIESRYWIIAQIQGLQRTILVVGNGPLQWATTHCRTGCDGPVVLRRFGKSICSLWFKEKIVGFCGGTSRIWKSGYGAVGKSYPDGSTFNSAKLRSKFPGINSGPES